MKIQHMFHEYHNAEFLKNAATDRCGVSPATSGTVNFRGVTGGVYKTRERIHRGMLIHDY
jgi:hypothetical protein